MSEALKKVLIYPTIGIIVFSFTFIANKYMDIILFGNRIDIRHAGIIFLVTIIAYSVPSLRKLNKLDGA